MEQTVSGCLGRNKRKRILKRRWKGVSYSVDDYHCIANFREETRKRRMPI